MRILNLNTWNTFFCVLNAALLKMINDRFVESLFFLVGIFSAFPPSEGGQKCEVC